MTSKSLSQRFVEEVLLGATRRAGTGAASASARPYLSFPPGRAGPESDRPVKLPMPIHKLFTPLFIGPEAVRLPGPMTRDLVKMFYI